MSRNSKKYPDPLTNFAPRSKKTKTQSNTKSLRSNKVNAKLIIELFLFFFDRFFNLTNILIIIYRKLEIYRQKMLMEKPIIIKMMMTIITLSYHQMSYH